MLMVVVVVVVMVMVVINVTKDGKIDLSTLAIPAGQQIYRRKDCIGLCSSHRQQFIHLISTLSISPSIAGWKEWRQPLIHH